MKFIIQNVDADQYRSGAGWIADKNEADRFADALTAAKIAAVFARAYQQQVQVVPVSDE